MIAFNNENFNDFVAMLYQKQDLNYKEFNDKVVNGVGESIGIRIPELRKIAKEMAKADNSFQMLALINQQNLFEMRMIEGMLIGLINADAIFSEHLIERFVETRINNWALCDSFVSSLKIKVTQNKAWFYEKAKQYAQSEKQWEIRFGLVMFLVYFKEPLYFAEIKDMVLRVKSQEYYVQMAAAWLISVLYVEMKDETLALLRCEQLNNWTRNKAIQKIKESYRVSAADKMLAASAKRQ